MSITHYKDKVLLISKNRASRANVQIFMAFNLDNADSAVPAAVEHFEPYDR